MIVDHAKAIDEEEEEMSQRDAPHGTSISQIN